jgi:hypothetical protein
MSSVVATGGGEGGGQWKVDHHENGATEVVVKKGGPVEWSLEYVMQHQPMSVVGVDGARDTNSIPGVSMYARQHYPTTFFKHEELVANKELFFEALNKFHTVLGTRLTKKGRKGKERAAEVTSFQESLAGIPPLGGVSIDLHLLYVEVTSRGGLEKVIKDRKWREVTSIFNFPDTITSGSYMVRKYYVGLLYYFEQAYFFGKQGPLVPPQVSMPGPLKKSVYSTTKSYPLSDGDRALQSIRKRKILPMQIMPVLDPASSIGQTAQGAIKGKFDQGYLVTVTVGGEKLQGVLYHVPPPALNPPQHADVSSFATEPEVKTATTTVWPRKRPRKEETLKRDPNAPRPNRTGYNFFFAEQSAHYKALHPDVPGLELCRIVGNAWNILTEHEKLPYQEQGLKDKERYRRELQEYREKQRAEETEALEPVTTTTQPEEEGAAIASDEVEVGEDGTENIKVLLSSELGALEVPN